MPEHWLSADDIDAHPRVPKDIVYTRIVGQVMPAHKVGRHRKFQASKIDGWVGRVSAAAHDDTEPD